MKRLVPVLAIGLLALAALFLRPPRPAEPAIAVAATTPAPSPAASRPRRRARRPRRPHAVAHGRTHAAKKLRRPPHHGRRTRPAHPRPEPAIVTRSDVDRLVEENLAEIRRSNPDLAGRIARYVTPP